MISNYSLLTPAHHVADVLNVNIHGLWNKLFCFKNYHYCLLSLIENENDVGGRLKTVSDDIFLYNSLFDGEKMCLNTLQKIRGFWPFHDPTTLPFTKDYIYIQTNVMKAIYVAD